MGIMLAMMLPSAAPMVLLVVVLAWDRLADPNPLPAAVGVIALFVLF